MAQVWSDLFLPLSPVTTSRPLAVKTTHVLMTQDLYPKQISL